MSERFKSYNIAINFFNQAHPNTIKAFSGIMSNSLMDVNLSKEGLSFIEWLGYITTVTESRIERHDVSHRSLINALKSSDGDLIASLIREYLTDNN
jgi:hypothetical protein